MPRSTVRKPNDQTDWKRHFRVCDDLPERLSSQTLFGNDRPLEIEIGSGKGLFMAAACTAFPEHNFVGIEIADRYARHAAGRIAKAIAGQQPPQAASLNALMVSGNAEPLLADRVDAGSVDAVHVYFPDPWWKKRHRKRRVIHETSISHICRILRGGGRFHFWTDVLDYFEITIEMIAATTPELGVPIPEEEAASSHELDYRTHFEKRSREHSIPVYRVRYEKRD